MLTNLDPLTLEDTILNQLTNLAYLQVNKSQGDIEGSAATSN